MKNITKKFIAFILLFLLTAGNVSAMNIFSSSGSINKLIAKGGNSGGGSKDGVVWNSGATGPDCPTINIANVETGEGYGYRCWNGTNISASSGQTVKVKVYYHNTTSITATNTHIKVIKQGNSFTAQILSPEGSLLQSGSVSVTIPSSQDLIYKETLWYPHQTQNSQTLLNNQNGEEVFSSSGLYIGDITGPGFEQQGSVVVSFLVGNTIPPQNCTINNFHANPTSVNSGGSSSLSWTTSGCTSVRLYNKNTGSLIFTAPSQYIGSGSYLVNNITNTTTYELKANKNGGSNVSAYTTVTVNTPPVACSISNFHANPTSVNSGGSSSLSWTTSGCTSVSIYKGNTLVGGPYNQNANSGSQIFQNIINTTTYTLKAYKQGGILADTKNVTVTVNTPPQTTGDIYADSSSCYITTGNSNCDIKFHWSTQNPGNTISYVKNNGNIVANGNNGNQFLSVSYGSQGFNLHNNNKFLDGTMVSASCTPGNSWNGTKCQLNTSPIMTGDITALQTSCLIPNGGNKCQIPFTWSTQNPIAISAITNNGQTVATGNKGHKNLDVSFGSQTYYLYNSGIELDQTSVEASCTPGTFWSGTSCTTIQTSCQVTNFSANPSTINQGQSSTLSWNTSGCKAVGIDDKEVNNFGYLTVWPTKTTTYKLTAYKSNGSTIVKSVTVVVSPIVNSCTIDNFSANPPTINSGQSSTLSWNTSGCNRVDISNVGNWLNLSGSKTVWPIKTTNYKLTAYGANGFTISKTITVKVNQNITPQNKCKISYFYADPSSILKGDYSTLNWGTEDCTSVMISGVGSNLPLSGSQKVWPTNTTTYILTAYGINGFSQNKSVTVIVNSNITPSGKCAISYFYSDPSSIEQGEHSELKWETNNCEKVKIDNVEVSLSGAKTVWPNNTTTYTLKAYGNSFWGIGMGSVSAQTTVYVEGNNNNNECKITKFEASDTNIHKGDSSTLEWDTENCVSVKISEVGNVSKNGTKKVYPNETTTYFLSAYGYGGDIVTDSVKIYVDENNNGGGGGGSGSSGCRINSFTASDTSINLGDAVTLNWRTSSCDDVIISNIGKVSDDGSKTIYPRQTETFTLRAYRNNKLRDSESIQIKVNYQNRRYNSDVVTLVATNISQNGAQLNGLITTPSYSNASTHFEYGTTVNLGLRTPSKNTVGYPNFSEYVTGLNPNTYYFYRAVLEKPNGVYYGAFEVFKTTKNGNVPIYVNNNNTKQVINQGTTVFGSESPVMLQIENKYQMIGVGDNIDYEVYYKNISKSTLTNPLAQVFIPEGILVTNISDGTYDKNSRTLSVPIDDLEPEEEGYIYLEAEVESIDSEIAQIVTTAILIFTDSNGAQENAMAYVLNTPKENSNLLGASAFFGIFQGMSLICWLFLIIIILLLALIARNYYNKRKTTPSHPTTTTVTH